VTERSRSLGEEFREGGGSGQIAALAAVDLADPPI
jgi:hypothetical protein